MKPVRPTACSRSMGKGERYCYETDIWWRERRTGETGRGNSRGPRAGKMWDYEFIPACRGSVQGVCSSIRFSTVPPSNVPRNQRTIRIASPFPSIPADHRWVLMKVYCTFRQGLHVAFSDDWIENRSLPIALLERTRGVGDCGL